MGTVAENVVGEYFSRSDCDGNTTGADVAAAFRAIERTRKPASEARGPAFSASRLPAGGAAPQCALASAAAEETHTHEAEAETKTEAATKTKSEADAEDEAKAEAEAAPEQPAGGPSLVLALSQLKYTEETAFEVGPFLNSHYSVSSKQHKCSAWVLSLG